MEETMNRAILTLTTTVLTLVAAFISTPASADHRDRSIRVTIPVHEHGPETINLKRLIRHQRQLDLDHYALQAVVLGNGPFSNGYATLRVGDRKSVRTFLPGREQIHIPSPGRAHDDWQLRLGPGTEVRVVTAILRPRDNLYSDYRYSDYRWNRNSHHQRAPVRHGHASHDRRRSDSHPYVAAGLAWMLKDGHADKKRAKKQKRRLKETRRELVQTREALKRTQGKLVRSRNQNRRTKAQQEQIHVRQSDRKRDQDARPSPDRKNRPDQKVRPDREIRRIAQSPSGSTKSVTRKNRAHHG
jgi:hypothetical protein